MFVTMDFKCTVDHQNYLKKKQWHKLTQTADPSNLFQKIAIFHNMNRQDHLDYQYQFLSVHEDKIKK